MQFLNPAAVVMARLNKFTSANSVCRGIPLLQQQLLLQQQRLFLGRC
jgi:hypothetical protein